jgi:excisionase family DNA binding protein
MPDDRLEAIGRLISLGKRLFGDIDRLGRRRRADSLRRRGPIPAWRRPPEGMKTFSVGQAAAILGVSTRTIVRWHTGGKLWAYRSPGNHRRIPLSEIEKLLVARRRGCS